MNQPREPISWAPLWLELSGLPAVIGQTVKGGHGWAVFRKVVELDCERNPQPDAVEISLVDLGVLVGCDGATTRKTVLGLRKLRLLACFLPETDEEAALLKVRTPLAVPLAPAEVAAAHPTRVAADGYFRYAQAIDDALSPEPTATPESDLQEIVDLYFNTVGLKMNSFVLDELRLLRERFGQEEIRRVFRRAQKAEVRSLSWVVGQLVKARVPRK